MLNLLSNVTVVVNVTTMIHYTHSGWQLLKNKKCGPCQDNRHLREIKPAKSVGMYQLPQQSKRPIFNKSTNFIHSFSFRCTVCRRRNDSFIRRQPSLDLPVREFRRGQERVIPAPQPVRQQPPQQRRTNYNYNSRRPAPGSYGYGRVNRRYPRSDTTAP